MRLLVLIIVLMIPILCFSEAELELAITVDSIEDFRFSNYPKVNQYSVGIQLNKDYTKKLEQITGENIRKELTIKLGSTILVKARIQDKIGSGQFSISTFNSPKESVEFMQNLLKDQYSAKLYIPKQEDFDFKLSHYDSLLIQIPIDFINFDYQSANLKLSELTEITKHNSDEYKNVLVNYLLMSLRANEYQKAQTYLYELNTFIDSNKLCGLDFYKIGGIFQILIFLANDKIEEAKALKKLYDNNIDWDENIKLISSLPYRSNNGKVTDFSNVFNVIAALPYHSYICYKLGDSAMANSEISEYITAFSKNGNLKGNSYYLLKLMYFYLSKSYKGALELSEQILDLDIEDFKYDTIQSKLWHSLILLKNDREEEALIFYTSAKNEFNQLEHPKDLTLKILLTPYLGAFPNDDVYKDFDKITDLADD